MTCGMDHCPQCPEPPLPANQGLTERQYRVAGFNPPMPQWHWAFFRNFTTDKCALESGRPSASHRTVLICAKRRAGRCREGRSGAWKGCGPQILEKHRRHTKCAHRRGEVSRPHVPTLDHKKKKL